MSQILRAILLAFFFALGAISTALAVDTSGTLWQSNVNIVNLEGDQDNFQSHTNISGANMIDDLFVADDYFNAVVHKNTNLTPSMPPNDLIVQEGAVLDDGGSFTEYTTAMQNATISDVALLPAIPVTGDAFYFGVDNPARILTINIGQEGNGAWSLAWAYSDGASTFASLPGVSDNTNAFRNLGTNTIAFTTPADWATRTVTGSAVTAYWLRATATVTGAGTQQALASQGWYENGRHWMWVEGLNQNQQEQYQLSFGGPDLIDHHQVFTGATGITTADDATMEPSDTFSILVRGSINFDNLGSDNCIVCKDGVIAVYPSAIGEVTASITGAGNSSLTITGITATTPTTGTTPGHTIRLISDATDLQLSVDATSATTGTQTVTNNSSGWVWAENTAMTYMDEASLLAGVTGSLQSYDTQGQWNAGALTGTTSYAGAREDVSTALIPIRLFRPHVFAETGEWNETTSGFDETTQQIEAGVNGANVRNIFMRFNNVTLPQGSTIATAFVRFRGVNSLGGGQTRIRVSAIDADDAVAPTTFTEAENATRTAAFVDWDPPSFSQGFERTDDISSIIQEIVDRPGWSDGNDLVIYWEDNGSDVGNRISSIDAIGSTPTNGDAFKFVLEIELIEDISTGFLDDFVQMSTDLTLDNSPWTDADVFNEVQTSGDSGAHQYGSHVLAIRGTGAAISESITQNIATTPGTVWSIGLDYSLPSGSSLDSWVRNLRINWLDSSLTVIGTAATAFTPLSNAWQTVVVNNQTAPASTSFMQYEIDFDCPGSCNAANDTFMDGAIACVAASTPIFTNSCNQLADGSFEGVYSDTTSTWESGAISAFNTVDNTVDSFIIWQASEDIPGSEDTTSLTVEVSIGDATNYQTATNGAAIPGIDFGEDLLLVNLFVRVTFANQNDIFTPFIHYLQLGVIDDDDGVMRYQLQTTPGVTITDQTGTGNTGTMSYPIVGLAGELATVESQRFPIAVGISDFASPVSGSDVASLFTEDTGSGFFLFEILNVGTTESNIPIQLFWVIIIITCGLMVGVATFRMTSSLAFAVVAIGACLTIATVMGTSGLVPMWTIFIFVLIAAALLLLRPRMPL